MHTKVNIVPRKKLYLNTVFTFVSCVVANSLKTSSKSKFCQMSYSISIIASEFNLS